MVSKYKGMAFSIITPLVSAFVGYLFSLHVDFISLKAQVISHEENLKEIHKKLDRIDENILNLLKK